ncbi:PGPGW domain-containing protein [Nocardioides korecus]
MKSTAKKWGVAVVGGLVLALGVVLMPLPGPGAVVVVLGMVILATQFEWADRRLDTVKAWAMKGAADSVRTWPRILLSVLGVVWLVGLGIVWGLGPDSPQWWPLADEWWLKGGWGTGSTLILSGLAALALLVYSFVRLREDGTPQGGPQRRDRVAG